MKFWRLIISIIFATFFIKNANSVSQPKLNKTFDEIFGKGWDAEVPEFTETKEWHKMETQTTEVENKSTDQHNPNEQSFSDHYESFANRKIRERFDEMFDENWSEDDNEFIEEAEADSTDQNDCIDGQKCQKVQKNGDPGTKLIKRRQNDYSDQQKREIVEEFISLIEKYKQKGKYSKKEWQKIYAQISESVGVDNKTIREWKKKVGLSQKLHSKQEKREKLKHYCEIKKNIPKIKDLEIAEILNIGKGTLTKWKKEFKNDGRDENDFSLQNEFSQLKVYSDQQKREIVQKFREMKDGYRQKGHTKEWKKNERKIANGLGVNRTKVYKWIKELGICREKF